MGLIGFVFVCLKLGRNADQIDLQNIGNAAWFTLLFLALIYGLASTMLARAWYSLLEIVDVRPTWIWALKAYGVSQLAKYIPGNIFHLAGRQALGQAAGFPGKALAKSALYELALVATTGMVFVALTIPLFIPKLSTSIGIIAFLLLFAIVFHLIRYWFGSFASNALVWESLFFMLSGMVFVVTLYMISPGTVDFELVPSLCGAYVVAWLLGFLTPGVPAGIGIRELVLTFLLRNIVPEVDLLLAVVLGRLITMVGDLVFFAFTGTLKTK